MYLIVGGYTQRMDEDTPGRARGISVYDFDRHEGRLDFIGFIPESNPSYVVTDRSRDIIYAVCEHKEHHGAAVSAHKLRRGKGGGITLETIGKLNIPGSDPCHLAFAGRQLAISCYASGQLVLVSLETDGYLGEVVQQFTFDSTSGRGIHIHCAVYQPELKRLLLTDLGDDKVKVLQADGDGVFSYVPEHDVQLTDSKGPRHIALSPDGHYAFVNGECRGILHVLDVSKPEISKVHVVNVLPERVVDQASGAALRLSRNGKMIYVSDRTFDVVNALRFDERAGTLKFRHSTPTGGGHPRDFALSPDGEWLLAANLKSSSIGVFKVDPRGELTHYHTINKVPTPTSLAWL